MASAGGRVRSNPGKGVSTSLPNAATKRLNRVVAALTVICCPRIARNPSSKISSVPGIRKPG